MSISIIPCEKKAEKNALVRIVCPDCGEKVKGVSLERGSRVEGLVFRCKRCGAYKAVKTE